MAVQTPSGLVAERPASWLGLAGFPPALRASVEAAVTRAATSCRWSICAFGEADGWWVNGAKCSIVGGDRLKVGAGLPTEHALKFELKEVHRPLAFAEPIAPKELDALCVFDPESEQSIQSALVQFENWLLPLRTQFVVGAMLVQRDPDDRRGIYHVSDRGTLLAVLDFQQGSAALSPRAHPADLWQAVWEKRPAGAGQVPKGFTKCTISQLAWAYVRRTDRDMLPARYRREVIYYRHVPRVPLGWLRDSQLMLLRELSSQPCSMQGLRERTTLPAAELAHDLACLYYAGSVTTTPESAVAAREGVATNSFGLWPEGAGGDPNGQDGLDVTAPALLERKPLGVQIDDSPVK